MMTGFNRQVNEEELDNQMHRLRDKIFVRD